MVNKQELIRRIADGSGISTKEAHKALDAVLDALTECMTAGEDVKIQNFGVFKIAFQDERQYRHPSTGELATASAHRKVTFRAGKALKDRTEKE